MVFPVARATAAGQTQFARRLLRVSGGKAANRAVQARRLGIDVRLFGAVGDDDLADQALAGPISAGVDTSLVAVVPGSTGVATILVDDQGEKSITIAPGANDAWPNECVDRTNRAIAEAPAGSVLACDVELRADAAEVVLETARRHSLPVVLDPAPPERVDTRMLTLADHVTPNATEAAQLIGKPVDSTESAMAAAAGIIDRGPKAAYVKLPGGGCVVAERGGAEGVVFKPPDLPVVDATGAGDAFAAAVAVALIEGRPPQDAAAWGVAASTCAVGQWGSQESYGDRRQLEPMARRVQRSPILV